MGSLSAVLEETTCGSQCTTRDPLYRTPRVELKLSRPLSVALTEISSSGYKFHDSCWKLSLSLTGFAKETFSLRANITGSRLNFDVLCVASVSKQEQRKFIAGYGPRKPTKPSLFIVLRL